MLGAVLSPDGGAATLARISAIVSPADFYRPSHGLILSAAHQLAADGKPTDVIMVADRLSRLRDGHGVSLLERVGGKERLVELALIVPATANAPHHAELVADAARRRDQLRLAQEIEQASLNGGVTEELRDRLGRFLALVTTGAERGRSVDGWAFISEASDRVPANWGDGDAVLWAEGEGLLLVGPDGVGKSSLAQQLVRARLGLCSELLGLPVRPSEGRVLYCAMDRPAQAARSWRRMVESGDEEVLRDRLIVHRGPLPFEILTDPPATLRQFAESHGATDLVIDSLKDLAVGLAKDEVGAAINRVFQEVIASGIELAALHHQRKDQQGATRPPKTLADVYGSRWLTAGMGSVVLPWGDAGDLVVSLRHLKQPAEEVGPFNVLHDHVHGRTSVHGHTDLETLLSQARHGLTVKDAARLLFGSEEPKSNEIEKARRRLEGLIAKNRAVRKDDPDGLARYVPREGP